jgi:hypothetical protein
MATTDRNDAVTSDPSQLFPTKYLPRPEVRDLPAPPRGNGSTSGRASSPRALGWRAGSSSSSPTSLPKSV